MLAHLRVVNLGVLDDAAIDPSPGLTVITGETGAGKTLLLGGLRLLLGGKADPALVGPVGEIAAVQGLFVDGDTELGVGRTVPRQGRSRASLEGEMVSAAALAERLGVMVEVVGQHDQLFLTRPSYLLEVLDGALDETDRAHLDAYHEAWRERQELLARQRALGGDRLELERDLDLARYQAREIATAGLTPDLEEELEGLASRLRNMEEIGEHLAETSNLSEQLTEATGELVARLRKAAGLDPALAPLALEAETLAELISTLGRGARDAHERMESDPAALEEAEARLTAIGDLKRKYGRTLDEVISYGEQMAARAGELASLIDDAGRIDRLVDASQAELRRAGDRLSEARGRTGRVVAEAMSGHLADLGLPSARLEVALEPVEPGPSGCDRVDLLFASDQRLSPEPVAAVASGGELSRLVLALRLATRRDSAAATLVFDEVDTGIGGRTALAMGRKLAHLAKTAQVLCVTHLPQVAAHGDTHYVVDRGVDGRADVRAVTGADRVTEITRMLAGLPESEAGRSAAEELLVGAGN